MLSQGNSMKNLIRTVGTLALLAAFNSSYALTVAVFGDNSLDEFLNSNGHTATVYSDADIAAGMANSADVFVYNRDGSGFGADLSAGAATEVLTNFGGGNTTAIFTDITDDYSPVDSTNLLLNSVAYSGNKGFMGLFNGAGWALENGLLPGTSLGETGNSNGTATYIVTQGHPVTSGLSGSWGSPQDDYLSYSTGIPSANVLAVDSAGNVLVAVNPVPEPGTMAVLGLGLAAAARRRRKA